MAAGYIMEGWKICIKLTKLPKYCCNNKKYLVFYTSARAVFLKETSHREWWKYHFWASGFQNFPEEDAPRPPIQLFVNSRLPRSFGSPLPPPSPTTTLKEAPPSLAIFVRMKTDLSVYTIMSIILTALWCFSQFDWSQRGNLSHQCMTSLVPCW